MGRALAVAAASVSVSVGGSVLGAPASAAELAEFSVTNFTDFHGHLEDDGTKEISAAKLAGLTKQVNQGQEYAFVSSGDNIGGSAFVSSVSEDKYSLEALNAMGVEATAVGNHEFDKGFDDLTGRIDAASDYPLLGAHVYKDGQRALESHFVKDDEWCESGLRGHRDAADPVNCVRGCGQEPRVPRPGSRDQHAG